MSKKAFSLAELLVSISIITILSAIGFISYRSYIGNARDSQRVSDIALISSALKKEKQKLGHYPNPGNNSDIVYDTSNILAKQGILNANVPLSALNKLPLDPKIDVPYIYSITKNAQEYEIALSLENSGNSIALLEGDYKSVSVNILPSIVLAFNTSSGTSIEIKNGVGNGTVNRNAFILNKQTKNLPYTFTAPYDPKIGTGTIDNLISQQKIKNLYWQNSNFKNCTEIETAKKLLLTGTTLEYQIIDDNGILTNINCP